MIFAGDVAVCPGEIFRFEKFPENLRTLPWCLNLEGSVVSSANVPDWGVVNSSSWVDSFSEFSLSPVFLANNHILDVENGVSRTTRFLQDNGLSSFGAGRTKGDAATPASVESDGLRYALVGFGWEVIGCISANDRSEGVNRLEGRAVRNQVSRALERGVDRVVVVIHGNYEFELYPQPGHRKLARELIDAGVYAVVFHHPHIVGPIERYKGRTIAYSLGNWAFSYGKFFGGKLRFPEPSFYQIALEFGRSGDAVHHANFSPPCTVTYASSELVASDSLSLAAVFEGFTDSEYLAWFKRNRKKRKLLPVYLDADDSFSNSLRDRWVSVRQVLVDLAAKHGLKAMRSA